MTPQKAYDKLVQSSLDGTFPSIFGNGDCVYQHPDNPKKKCDAGIFIPEEMLKDIPEQTTLVDALPEHIKDCFPFPTHDMLEIQSCHDRTAHDKRFVAPPSLGPLNLRYSVE